MSAKMIDGTATATRLRESLKEEVSDFVAKANRPPGLAVVLVGDDPASEVYVRMKEKACAQVGLYSVKHRLPKDASQEEVLHTVQQLNDQDEIDGILVQLPLPGHIDEAAVIEAVSVDKDVDGFHPYNVGLLASGSREALEPCTPAGVMELLKTTGVDLVGKNAVVIGRSNIVGKPTAHMLLREHATVTIAHSRTQDLAGVCRRADVLVVAVGRAEMVTPEYVRPGAIVIDVGVNRLGDGRLVGDVHFDSVKDVAGFITPVPGGVGPMTITMLLKNTLRAAQRRLSL